MTHCPKCGAAHLSTQVCRCSPMSGIEHPSNDPGGMVADHLGKRLREAETQRDALLETLSDMLNMLRAAHIQCGIHHDSNKRVIKAREVLANVKGISAPPTNHQGDV